MPTVIKSSKEVANDTIVTTAETVLCTLSGVSTGRQASVQLRGWAQVTTGTATTALTPRIRRGVDATGVLIGEADPVTIGAAAGGTENLYVEAEDIGVDLSNATYVLTVVQTAATGNGTGLQASLEAQIQS
jgi:hypothetical protein